MLVNEIASAAKQAAREAGRVIALLLAVGVSALVALGFLTAAAYQAAASAFGPVEAALAIAAFYAVAAIVLALTLSRPATARPEAPQDPDISDAELMSRVLDAFMTGFRAGRGRRQ